MIIRARIDERRRTEIWLQMAHLHNPVRHKSQRQPAYNADHPGRKIGTEDIDRR